MLPIVMTLLSAAVALSPPDGSGRPPPAPSDDPAIMARRGLAIAARGDPEIAEVQEAAARWAEPLAPGNGSAARAAALLPRLTAEFRVEDRSYRVSGVQGSGEVDYTRQAPGWRAGLRATWDLAALVSPPAERVDAKGALDRARRRDEAVKRATSLYYERRALRLALALTPPTSPAERAAAELEVERLAAELDALTGGGFTGAPSRGHR
jgi:hypothetical protein